MIRILFVDDHPALRAGLETVIAREPGLVAVGAAAGEADVGPVLARTRPDLVLLDYHLPTTNGLVLCHRIKRTVPPPRVILYSAYADASMTVPALLAGADAVLSKSVRAYELFAAIRAVMVGERVLPSPSPDQFTEAAARLPDEDVPILGMLVEGTPPGDIADALRVAPRVVIARIERMLGRLRVEVPASAV
jgi:DNA-binding NarL/FixJ family response regulator